LLTVEVDTTQPVMAGFAPTGHVFFNSSPAFETTEGFKGTVLAKYGAEGALLASGYLLGESHLRGKAAALEVQHGNGKVVLLGFRPQWRGQTFGTFKVLFNALSSEVISVSSAGNHLRAHFQSIGRSADIAGRRGIRRRPSLTLRAAAALASVVAHGRHVAATMAVTRPASTSASRRTRRSPSSASRRRLQPCRQSRAFRPFPERRRTGPIWQSSGGTLPRTHGGPRLMEAEPSGSAVALWRRDLTVISIR
jgi:hypothetical protein